MTRRAAFAWLALTGLALSGCTTGSDRSAPPVGPATSASIPPTSTSTSPTRRPPASTSPAVTITAAWAKAMNAFYEASNDGNARLPGLLATLVPGSPSYEQETTYIAAQSVSGIAGPASWRIGAVALISSDSRKAVVSGCSFDEGSHYVSSGAQAPSTLGGSPGLTGYLATMERVGGSWLLYSTRVTSPSTSKEAGPCHDFEYTSSS